MRGGKRLLKEAKRPLFRGRTILLVCAVILAAGGVLALHIFSSQRRAAQDFSRFHISSNYLEEEGSSYTVMDWGGGFDILLFNHEKEDISQLSTVDMAYTVTAEHAAVSVTRQNGEAVKAADGVYLFGAEPATAYHILHVTPDAGQEEPVVITVQTTSPYQKTMTAEFRLQAFQMPEYTVTDQNNGTIMITVTTHDYEDSMTVTWDPMKYWPDHSNTLMASWRSDATAGQFPVDRDSTYELVFYKRTNDPYTEQTGAATLIALD